MKTKLAAARRRRSTRSKLIRRWVLIAIKCARGFPVAETLILVTIHALQFKCTALQLRREFDYLERRGLIGVKRHEGAPWLVELLPQGVDVVKRTVGYVPGRFLD